MGALAMRSLALCMVFRRWCRPRYSRVSFSRRCQTVGSTRNLSPQELRSAGDRDVARKRMVVDESRLASNVVPERFHHRSPSSRSSLSVHAKAISA